MVAGYALNKFTAFEAGYGHFFTGKYIDQTWENAGGIRGCPLGLSPDRDSVLARLIHGMKDHAAMACATETDSATLSAPVPAELAPTTL